MWSALKSDLSEFVSGVKEDGSNVLSTIDNKLEKIENNLGKASRAVEEGTTTDTNGGDGTNDNTGSMIIGEDGDVEYTTGGVETTGVISSAVDEAIRRMNHEETFLAPLEPTVDDNDEDGGVGGIDDEEYNIALKEYLSTFKIEDKTEEIASLLEEHPETLKKQFESIVPTELSYEEFWKRCLFRCDPERISKEWEREEERTREARAKAIKEGVASVKNLFGSAVTAVSKTLESTTTTRKADDSGGVGQVAGSPYQYNVPQSQAPDGSAWFGSGGRPPFVMNTAVDEDDKDGEESEEEEEEELGWDDDDEDFDDDEEEEEVEETDEDAEAVNRSAGEEEIDFSNAAEIEDLKQQLAQTTEERDQLHETVEMQRKAMTELQEQQQNQQQPSSSSDGNSNSNNDEEIEKLKMDLFEKNSELAALKASLEDTQDAGGDEALRKANVKVEAQGREIETLKQSLEVANGNNTEQASEIDRLNTEMEDAHIVFGQTSEKLQGLEHDIEQLQSQSEADKAVMEQLRSQSQADKESLFDAQATNTELQTKLSSLEEELAQAKAEIEQAAAAALSATTSSADESTQEQLAEALEEAKTSNEMVDSLREELEEVRGNLTVATNRADELDAQLNKAQEALQSQEVEFATKLENEIAKIQQAAESSPAGSSSSAVKVEAVSPIPSPSSGDDDAPQAATTTEDDEGDWGDDWGDDDDL